MITQLYRCLRFLVIGPAATLCALPDCRGEVFRKPCSPFCSLRLCEKHCAEHCRCLRARVLEVERERAEIARLA